MSIRKGMLIVGALSCLVTTITAQKNYDFSYPKLEVGLQVGMTEFLGDLGGGNGEGKSFITDTDWQYSKPLIGIYAKKYVTPMWAYSANLNFTQIKGSDTATDNPGRQARGLTATSNIWELYGLAHFSPLRFGKVGVHLNAGLGAFHFNPTTENAAENPNAQNNSFSKVQLMIPLGAGVTYALNENWVLGADVMHRTTFTDYLDNYKSPYTNKNDAYYSLIFKVGYVFDKTAGGKGMGCPNTKF